MPTSQESEKVSRITLDLSQKSRDRLTFLQEATKADTPIDVVREALRIYDALLSRTLAGETLIFHKIDGSQEVVVFNGTSLS